MAYEYTSMSGNHDFTSSTSFKGNYMETTLCGSSDLSGKEY